MTSPIYQLFVANKNISSKLAWKALSASEQKALIDQEQASQKTAGAKMVLGCDSAWADEMHPAWGVIRFPDLQARIEHTHRLDKMGWLNFSDAFTLLGTCEAEPQAVTIANPIYKLWIIKNNPATALTRNMPKGLEALMWEKHNTLMKEHGGQMLLYCDTAWCNEAYSGFGIDAFPEVEANMKIMAGLNELGWPGYFEAITYLGISLM